MINRDEIIRDKIREIIADQGIELIEYKLFSNRSTQVIRCLIDYHQGGISLDVCAKTNKRVVAFLNESKLLGDDFSVEINSPGIDRHLRSSKDFLRVRGKIICLWLKGPREGKDYLEGEVKEVSDDELTIAYKDSTVRIKFTDIKTGKEKISL